MRERVHLAADLVGLTSQRLVAKLSRHVVAVVDGEIRDLYDCSRDGNRMVYAMWTPEPLVHSVAGERVLSDRCPGPQCESCAVRAAESTNAGQDTTGVAMEPRPRWQQQGLIGL